MLKFDKYFSFIEKIADIPNHSSYNNYSYHVYGDLVAPAEKSGCKRLGHAGK